MPKQTKHSKLILIISIQEKMSPKFFESCHALRIIKL